MVKYINIKYVTIIYAVLFFLTNMFVYTTNGYGKEIDNKENNSSLLTQKIVKVKDIELSNHENELKVDETLTLTANVLPVNATNQVITFKSSNKKVATVNSTGEVKGLSKGIVIIKISAGKITKRVKLSVVVPTTKINLSDKYLILKPGNSKKIYVDIIPKEAEQKVNYKSTNQDVVSVSMSGLICAKNVGEATVIVSNNDLSAAITVIVNEDSKKTKHKVKKSTKEVCKEYDNPSIAKVVSSDEYPILDSKLLKNLYDSRKKLTVKGNGYSILVDGNNIVNYNNELKTRIRTIKRDNDKLIFEINEGNNLCGPITLSFHKVEGKYLYLYNKFKDSYDRVQMSSNKKIVITTAGKYMITDNKIKTNREFFLYIMGCGFILTILLLIIYIAVKKKYWFW